MKTRAQELLDDAASLLAIGSRCRIEQTPDTCYVCSDLRQRACDLARVALLSTLRKRRLELTYFVDAERASLDAQRQARLTNRT